MSNPSFPDQKAVLPTDSDYCHICGALSSEKKLVVVKDVSRKNNKLNLRILLCIDCFHLKTFSELCASESEKIVEKQVETTELRQSRKKENRFRRFVYEKLQKAKDKRWEESDLINSGAEAVDISTTTAGRYLAKMCSSEGVLKREDDGENAFVGYNMKELLDLIEKLGYKSQEDLQ